MKCPNCGFNCDDKYCAMCGTKMPEQVINTSPNPYESASVNNNNFQSEKINQPNSPDFSAGFGNSNPYNHPQPPVNNANSYQNNFQNGVPDMPQSGMPVPPAYPAAPQYSNTPKKKSKALPIILTCLIASVIVAGAVISVYSACTYNQSIIVGLIGDISDYSSNYYDIEEEYNSDITEYIEDAESHKIGDTKELSDCKVTLTKIEKDKSAVDSKSGNSRARYVFEIENTTDEYLTLTGVYCDATNADNYTSLDWLSDNLETDDVYSGYIILVPNEKKEITFDYSVPNDAEKVQLDLCFFGDGNKYEYNGTFIAE